MMSLISRSADMRALLAGFVLLGSTTLSHAVTVTIASGAHTRYVRDGVSSSDSSATPASLGSSSGSLTYGSSNVEDVYELGHTQFKTFSITERSGAHGTVAESSGLVEFSVDANVLYAASGAVAVSNLSGSNLISMDVRASLYDVTAGSYLFDFTRVSQHTSASSVNLNTAASTANQFDGSLTGELTAGNRYQWRYFLNNWSSFSDEATSNDGTSFAQLDFSPVGTPPAAPLPSAAVAGIVLLGTRWARRTRNA